MIGSGEVQPRWVRSLFLGRKGFAEDSYPILWFRIHMANVFHDLVAGTVSSSTLLDVRPSTDLTSSCTWIS